MTILYLVLAALYGVGAAITALCASYSSDHGDSLPYCTFLGIFWPVLAVLLAGGLLIERIFFKREI